MRGEKGLYTRTTSGKHTAGIKQSQTRREVSVQSSLYAERTGARPRSITPINTIHFTSLVSYPEVLQQATKIKAAYVCVLSLCTGPRRDTTRLEETFRPEQACFISKRSERPEGFEAMVVIKQCHCDDHVSQEDLSACLRISMVSIA